MSRPSKVPGAIIFGISGFELTSDEKALFKEINPFGFILFSRNCDNPGQVKKLISELRYTVDRPDAPIFNFSKLTILISNFLKRNFNGVKEKYDKCSW